MSISFLDHWVPAKKRHFIFAIWLLRFGWDKWKKICKIRQIFQYLWWDYSVQSGKINQILAKTDVLKVIKWVKNGNICYFQSWKMIKISQNINYLKVESWKMKIQNWKLKVEKWNFVRFFLWIYFIFYVPMFIWISFFQFWYILSP